MHQLKRDTVTGLALYAETRDEPGGGQVVLYRIVAPQGVGLPEHLAPTIPGDRMNAEASYAALVEYLTENPPPKW